MGKVLRSLTDVHYTSFEIRIQEQRTSSFNIAGAKVDFQGQIQSNWPVLRDATKVGAA